MSWRNLVPYNGAGMRLTGFIVVAIAAIVAFYPNYGFLYSIGISVGLPQIELMLVLPIILFVAAGLVVGVRLGGFMLLMFVASVAFYPAMGFAFSIAQPKSGWLHFALLFVLPSLLILGAGYAMGVLSNRHTFTRFLVFSIAAVALPPVAIYVSMFLWILAFGL